LVFEFFEEFDEYFTFGIEDALVLEIDTYLIFLDVV